MNWPSFSHAERWIEVLRSRGVLHYIDMHYSWHVCIGLLSDRTWWFFDVHPDFHLYIKFIWSTSRIFTYTFTCTEYKDFPMFILIFLWSINVQPKIFWSSLCLMFTSIMIYYKIEIDVLVLAEWFATLIFTFVMVWLFFLQPYLPNFVRDQVIRNNNCTHFLYALATQE